MFVINNQDQGGNFGAVTTFLSELVGRMNTLASTTRFAVIGFSSSARVIMQYYTEREGVQTVITNLRADGSGAPNVTRGMEAALTYLEQNQRADAARLIVVLTAGNDQVRCTARDRILFSKN